MYALTPTIFYASLLWECPMPAMDLIWRDRASGRRDPAVVFVFVATALVLVGILAIARVPYDRWFRFIMPFMIKIWVAGSIALAIAVWIGFS